jgi:hypothetical protein
MRVDGTSTVQINASERKEKPADTFAPASFFDASSNGKRAFFMTTQALTDDTPTDGASHIYMYDTTQPEGERLTLINADHEPGDGTSSDGQGIFGLSHDGSYVYFMTTGQIVSGQPLLGDGGFGLYLWHDGTVRYITLPGVINEDETFTTGGNISVNLYQSRVSPDGRWLLYRALAGGTLELYLYSADSGAAPVCVSCDPSGAPPTAVATDVVRTGSGAAVTSWHENHALSDDGSHVFFSTAAALVPEDVNNKEDVYEYDTSTASVHLISSGTSTDDSWFMDASANGDNVFFTTRQQLVGWDIDQEYDVYDARIGGGVPQPSVEEACGGEACQVSAVALAGPSTPVTVSFSGPGNPLAVAIVKKRTQGLEGALRACKKLKAKGRRKRCEAAARKRYAKHSLKTSGRTR